MVPYSRPEGKPWLTERITAQAPQSILDVGAGSGTYWNILRHLDARWTGVEIHAPYVRKYRLDKKYDRLIVGDFLEVELDPHDAVILGDVLEHVRRDRAQEMWDKARSLGVVYMTLPLDHFEQGAVFGNHHETHLWHWSHEEVLGLGGVTDSWVGPHKGAYVCA